MYKGLRSLCTGKISKFTLYPSLGKFIDNGLITETEEGEVKIAHDMDSVIGYGIV